MKFNFDEFELDTARFELRKNGEPVTVEPQVFSLINLLVENPDRVISKDELIGKIWDGRFISDEAVASRISLARKALGDDGKNQRIIKTVHGRGIRFVSTVTQLQNSSELPNRPTHESPPREWSISFNRQDVSIAVLPFDNLSSEREHEYLVDGIVEDITTSLAQTGWLFVTSRNSSFAYKGKPTDIKQVGIELGVRYVLEGSIRRAKNALRITAQLIETDNGGHIWADKFEGSIEEIYELQDKITERVVGAIEPGLRRAETKRSLGKPTDNLDAYDYHLRGIYQMYTSTHASLDLAVKCFKTAIDLDPNYQLTKAYLALALAIRDTAGWTQSDDRDLAISLAREAITEADENPETLRTAGYALGYFAEKDDRVIGDDLFTAAAALERSLSLHPTSAQTLNSLGFVRLWSGETDQAASYFNRAIEISPQDQELGYVLVGLATAKLVMAENEEALEVALRAISEMPKNGSAHRIMIVALVRLDRLRDAKAATERLLKLIPDATLSDVKPLTKPFGYSSQFLSDLLKAGYPKERR